MNRIYFQDTDTLLFEFGDTYVDGPIDHVDLDYQTSLEFDCEGNLVALTIEHARKRVSEQVSSGKVWNREPSTVKRFYAKDTDTLMFVFRNANVGEELDHVELDDDTALELDCDGNPVGLTIEFARERGVLPEHAAEQTPA